MKSWQRMLNSTKNLIHELEKELTSENVLSTKEECYAYAQDASNTRIITNIPDAVVFVRDKNDVIEVVKKASKYNMPIICRGAGTNTVGACRIEHGGIILNFSKMNKILEINKENMTAKVQPGVILGELQKEAEKIGLYYPPDPSNLMVSTIGGSIAQSSGGARTLKYGSTKNYILNLEVITAQGEIMYTGSDTVKNAAGYNLTSLFVGSEGTLGIITEATLKLIPKPEDKKVIMAYFDTVEDSISAVNQIIAKQIAPATIDFMDKNAITTVEKFYPIGLLSDKDAALVIEIDGFKNSIEYQQDIISKILKANRASSIQISNNEEEYNKIWQARRSSMGACAKLKPNVTTDDVIVPRERLALLVSGIQKICKKYNLEACLVGHVGDGSVHPQIPIDYGNEDEYHRYKMAKSEIYDLTTSLGGIISGEHGIGADKRPFINQSVNGIALNYMRAIKQTFDPQNILNPYKIF